MTPQENTVKQLSKNNTINKPIDERGRTPLMQAAVDNDIPTMEYLLKYGAQVDLQTQYGNSALIFASMEGHSNAVEMLVNAKADVNLINNDGFNAVMQAARCGYVRVLKHLLHAGADVDVQDNEKETALIRAAKAGQVKTVKLLLENSANIDIHDSNDKSAYEWAKELNEKECVILFEEQEEERRRRGDLFNEKEASFIQAASDGDVSKLLAIIEEGININCQDKSGYSALILASMKGKDKVVKVLLDRHAEVDLTTKHGHTALIRAARKGHGKVVKVLLEAHADVTIKDFESELTALDWAKSREETECVELLSQATTQKQATTEDQTLKKKNIKHFKTGNTIEYFNSKDVWEMAVIQDVSYDGDLEPYFTIAIGGDPLKEKGTILNRIRSVQIGSTEQTE